MFFRIGNVDSAKIDADIEANRNNFYRKDGVNYRSLHWWVSKAREAGDWTLDRVSIGIFRGVDEDEWSVNTSRIMGVDATDTESLTKGEIVGRQQVKEIFAFLKKYVPGCGDARLLETGSTLGIRETRHIHGIKTLTVDDLLECKVPEDSVMLAANSVDVHGRFGPKSNEYIALPEGRCYGIPYGCMVTPGLANLLVAGRCVSAESEAAGAIRVMPPCMGMGEAAGSAAAMGGDLRDLDTRALRDPEYEGAEVDGKTVFERLLRRIFEPCGDEQIFDKYRGDLKQYHRGYDHGRILAEMSDDHHDRVDRGVCDKIADKYDRHCLFVVCPKGYHEIFYQFRDSERDKYRKNPVPPHIFILIIIFFATVLPTTPKDMKTVCQAE